jgi:two-component system NarL family response regulator
MKTRPLTGNFPRKQMLIVEDGEQVRNALGDYLRFWFPEYGIKQVPDAEKALTAINDDSFEVVLMDIGLPGMNGIQATREIKRSAPQLPVIIITIHNHPNYIVEATEAGASAFLSKDRMYVDLVTELKKVLSSAET